jgi:hypothetical protein
MRVEFLCGRVLEELEGDGKDNIKMNLKKRNRVNWRWMKIPVARLMAGFGTGDAKTPSNIILHE